MEITKEMRQLALLVGTPDFLLSTGIPDSEAKEEIEDILFPFINEMDSQHELSRLADRDQLKHVYLETIPRYWPFFIEDAPRVEQILMRLYFILGREKQIPPAEAEKCVLFLQGAQDIFLANLNDSSRYSREKQELFTFSRAQLEVLNELTGFNDYQQFLESLDPQKSFDSDELDFDEMDFAEYSGYQIRVDLEGFKPPIWRRLILPAELSYQELHEILQAAFGWQDNHRWFFEANTDRIEADTAEIIAIDDDFDTLDRLLYVYDPDSDWTHQIKIEKRLEDESLLANGVQLVKAVGDTPEEGSRDDLLWVPLDLKKTRQRLSKVWKNILAQQDWR